MAERRPQRLRLFVACELPDDVRDALGGIQEELRRQGAGRLRWVRPEGIHITLKFLGEVEQARVDAIISALEAVIEPFELRVRPANVGSFGGARVRVVWVGLEGDVDDLATLAGCVDAALAPLGFPREKRPFAAHLTLARVPDRALPEERRRLADLLRRFRPPPLPSTILTKAALIRSVLGQRGSVYHEIASFPRET